MSPALDLKELEQYHFDNVYCVELDSVVRQSLGSGILNNATQLRFQLNEENYDQFQFDVDGVKDIHYSNSGMDLFDSLSNALIKINDSFFFVNQSSQSLTAFGSAKFVLLITIK